MNEMKIKKYVLRENERRERRWVLVRTITIPYGCRLWLKLLFGGNVKHVFNNGRWYRYVIQR